INLENLFAGLERYPKDAETPFSHYLKTRLKNQDASVDGILCWNFFDFLDLASAQVLAASLTRLLRPDGAVLAFFTTVGVADSRFSRYLIVDENSVKQRPYFSPGQKKTA